MPPERIVDYLTLVGDAVDNVPGVEKVGPKTAGKWIGQYGSLDAIVEHADEIGGAVGENLRKALPWLPTARALVTVKSDCDLGGHVESMEALADRGEDSERLRELFTRYEFKSWLKDIGQPPPAGGDAPVDAEAAPAAVRAARRAVRDGADARAAGALAGPDRRGRTHEHRHRDDLARSARGAAGRPVAVGRTVQGLLHPAGAPLRGSAGSAAVRGDAGRAETVAREPAPPQGGPAPEVRHARVREPRRPPGGHRARHPAAVVRAGGASQPRHGLARGAPPAAQDADLRRGVRQGRQPAAFRRGRARPRDRVRGGGRRGDVRAAPRAVAAHRGGAGAAAHLRGHRAADWRRCSTKWSAAAC